MQRLRVKLEEKLRELAWLEKEIRLNLKELG